MTKDELFEIAHKAHERARDERNSIMSLYFIDDLQYGSIKFMVDGMDAVAIIKAGKIKEITVKHGTVFNIVETIRED